MVPALEHSQPRKKRDEKCFRSWKNCDFPRRLWQLHTVPHVGLVHPSFWEMEKILQSCCTSVSSKDLKRFKSVSVVSQCPINCLPLKYCEEPRVWVQREPKFVSLPRQGSAKGAACCCSRREVRGQNSQLSKPVWAGRTLLISLWVLRLETALLSLFCFLPSFSQEAFLRQGRRYSFCQSCCQSSLLLSGWEFCYQAKHN